LGATVFLQRCRQDGEPIDTMLFKSSRRDMAAEDGWELLQF